MELDELNRIADMGPAGKTTLEGLMQQVSPHIAYPLQFFKFEHLPEKLQVVSRPFCELAMHVATGPSNQSTTRALWKLLEAKDDAVRAFVNP